MPSVLHDRAVQGSRGLEEKTVRWRYFRNPVFNPLLPFSPKLQGIVSYELCQRSLGALELMRVMPVSPARARTGSGALWTRRGGPSTATTEQPSQRHRLRPGEARSRGSAALGTAGKEDQVTATAGSIMLPGKRLLLRPSRPSPSATASTGLRFGQTPILVFLQFCKQPVLLLPHPGSAMPEITFCGSTLEERSQRQAQDKNLV